MLLAAEVGFPQPSQPELILTRPCSTPTDGHILHSSCTFAIRGPQAPLPLPLGKSHRRKDSLRTQDIIHVRNLVYVDSPNIPG